MAGRLRGDTVRFGTIARSATSFNNVPNGEKIVDRKVFPWVSSDPVYGPTVRVCDLARTHGVPARLVIKHLESEMRQEEACCSLPFTLLFVVSYACVALWHDDARTIDTVERALHHDLHNADMVFVSPWVGHKTLEAVSDADSFFQWISEALLPRMLQPWDLLHDGYNESSELYLIERAAVPSLWLGYNRIVGGIRFRQERSENAAFTCVTHSSLLSLYGEKCVGGLDYNLDPEQGLPTERALKTNRPVREVWLYLAEGEAVALDTLQLLSDTGWLDRQTMKVEVAIPSYNAEYGLHTLTFINFYFSRGGHIWKKIIGRSQHASLFPRWYAMIADLVWLLCILYIVLHEVQKIAAHARATGIHGIIFRYFKLWNVIDWICVFWGLVLVIFFVVGSAMQDEMNVALRAVGDLDPSETEFRELVQEYIAAAERNAGQVRWFRLFLAGYPLVIIFRLFKSFHAQPRLSVVTRTMLTSLVDLIHFAIIFFTVFFAFAVSGGLIFGSHTKNFVTLPRALTTCFRIMLGDIDFVELEEVGILEASAWLWLFILCVGLVLLNMILAIIMGKYATAQEQVGRGKPLWEEARQLVQKAQDQRTGKRLKDKVVLEALVRLTLDRNTSFRNFAPVLARLPTTFLSGGSGSPKFRLTPSNSVRDNRDDNETASVVSDEQPCTAKWDHLTRNFPSDRSDTERSDYDPSSPAVTVASESVSSQSLDDDDGESSRRDGTSPRPSSILRQSRRKSEARSMDGAEAQRSNPVLARLPTLLSGGSVFAKLRLTPSNSVRDNRDDNETTSVVSHEQPCTAKWDHLTRNFPSDRSDAARSECDPFSPAVTVASDAVSSQSLDDDGKNSRREHASPSPHSILRQSRRKSQARPSDGAEAQRTNTSVKFAESPRNLLNPAPSLDASSKVSSHDPPWGISSRLSDRSENSSLLSSTVSSSKLLVTAQDLQDAVCMDDVHLSEEQALSVLCETIAAYYESHREHAELDEMVHLTQQAHTDVLNNMQLLRRANQMFGVGAACYLDAFGVELRQYLDFVSREDQQIQQELERLHRIHYQEQLRLMAHVPGAQIPETSHLTLLQALTGERAEQM